MSAFWRSWLVSQIEFYTLRTPTCFIASLIHNLRSLPLLVPSARLSSGLRSPVPTRTARTDRPCRFANSSPIRTISENRTQRCAPVPTMCKVHYRKYYPCGHANRSGIFWVCRKTTPDKMMECPDLVIHMDTKIPPGFECRMCRDGLTQEQADEPEEGISTPERLPEDGSANGFSRASSGPGFGASASSSSTGQQHGNTTSGSEQGGSGASSSQTQNVGSGRSA